MNWDLRYAMERDNKSIIRSGDKIIVPVIHGKTPKLTEDELKSVKDVAQKHGYWEEGAGGDPIESLVSGATRNGSWDTDGYNKSIKNIEPFHLSPMFSNTKANDGVQKLTSSSKTIFQSLLDTQYGNPIFKFEGTKQVYTKKYNSSHLEDFLTSGSTRSMNLLEMSRLPATRENVSRFLSSGEKSMWPSGGEPGKTPLGKMAQQFNDGRNQFLANAGPGVYFAGADHIPDIRKLI